jgi:predicted DNA-binding protein (MmcQ/YjbR family)
MFALLNLDEDHQGVLSFAAGPERYAELLETEGVVPAPYLARAHWVALRHWGVLRSSELEELLKFGHGLVYARLPRKTKDVLAMPPGAQRKLLKERKKLLAARGASR